MKAAFGIVSALSFLVLCLSHTALAYDQQAAMDQITALYAQEDSAYKKLDPEATARNTTPDYVHYAENGKAIRREDEVRQNQKFLPRFKVYEWKTFVDKWSFGKSSISVTAVQSYRADVHFPGSQVKDYRYTVSTLDVWVLTDQGWKMRSRHDLFDKDNSKKPEKAPSSK